MLHKLSQSKKASTFSKERLLYYNTFIQNEVWQISPFKFNFISLDSRTTQQNYLYIWFTRQLIKHLVLTFLLSITLHIFHTIRFLFAGLINILVATLTISTTNYNHSSADSLTIYAKKCSGKSRWILNYSLKILDFGQRHFMLMGIKNRMKANRGQLHLWCESWKALTTPLYPLFA